MSVTTTRDEEVNAILKRDSKAADLKAYEAAQRTVDEKAQSQREREDARDKRGETAVAEAMKTLVASVTFVHRGLRIEISLAHPDELYRVIAVEAIKRMAVFIGQSVHQMAARAANTGRTGFDAYADDPLDPHWLDVLLTDERAGLQAAHSRGLIKIKAKR